MTFTFITQLCLLKAQWLQLNVAILTVVVVVGLMLAVKKLIGMRVENIGPELNLLTFGFLWDTIIKSFGGNYWEHFPEDWKSFKPLVLAWVFVINIFMTFLNLKLTVISGSDPSRYLAKRGKLWQYFMGIVSLMIFIVLQISLDYNSSITK